MPQGGPSEATREKKEKTGVDSTACSLPANTAERGPRTTAHGEQPQQSSHEGGPSVSVAPRRPSGLCDGAPTRRPRVTLSAPPATAVGHVTAPTHSAL